MSRRTPQDNGATAYRQQLKERILDTAMELFANKGVRAVKMDDIAQTLIISKRTLYELYSNKEDLLCEGLKKYHDLMQQKNDTIIRGAGNVMDILLMICQHTVAQQRGVSPIFYSDMSRYPKVMNLLHRMAEERLEERKAFIRRGVEEGYFRPDVNIELALEVSEILSTGMMREGVFQKYGIEEIYNSVVFLTLRGLCTEQGVRVVDRFLKENGGSLS